MKKITATMIALMIVLGMSQCRKPADNDELIHDVTKVGVSCVIPINNDGKSEFDNLMTDGTVKWSAGTERIYLAIPDETNPQIIELTAFTTVESNVLAFKGEAAEGLIQPGEYEVWYLGNSKNMDVPYITETKDGEVIKGISGSIATQSGNLEDLGYCHIAKTTVAASLEDEEVVLSMRGILKNQIAIAHLDLQGIMQLKGSAVIGTEYSLQYNEGAFEFAVTSDASSNIVITEGTTSSYVVMFPNDTEGVVLKSNTAKKVTFKDGVKAGKIYYEFISDMEYNPLVWEDDDEINMVDGHEYVDLGLPSGLLWATCNVGAGVPEAYGDYYAWGDTTAKGEYTEANSITRGKLMNDISGDLKYDVARAGWGGSWRMPTDAEQEELLNNCTWEWSTLNGVNGYNVTGQNGRSIFLPAAGYCSGSTPNNEESGCYWSSSPNGDDANYARGLYFSSGDHYMYDNDRYFGVTVRPVSGGGFEGPAAQYAFVNTTEVTEITAKSAVCGGDVTTDNGYEVMERGVCWSTNENPTINDNKTVDGSDVGTYTSNLTVLDHSTTYYVRAYATNAAGTNYGEQKSFTTKPSYNGYEYVDLGLPSGLKWAAYNVGAEKPEDCGTYYAWGETQPAPDNDYSGENCCTHQARDKDLLKDGIITIIDDYDNYDLTSAYDAASVNWGAEWRMPSYADIEELINNCTSEWTTLNGVYGRKVTSNINGNHIFLPAAGSRKWDGGWSYSFGEAGCYWSSYSEEDGYTYSVTMDFDDDDGPMFSSSGRAHGLTVRAVFR